MQLLKNWSRKTDEMERKSDAQSSIMSGVFLINDINLTTNKDEILLRVITKHNEELHILTDKFSILKFIVENSHQLLQRFPKVTKQLLNAFHITQEQLLQVESQSQKTAKHENYLSSVYGRDSYLFRNESGDFYANYYKVRTTIKKQLLEGFVYFTDVKWRPEHHFFITVGNRCICLDTKLDIWRFIDTNSDALKKYFPDIYKILPAIYFSIDFKLFNAIDQNQLQQILELIQQGANINCQDEDGNTALMNAIKKKNASLVDFLLAHGAMTNIKNNKSYHKTAMSLAIEIDSLSIVKKLLTYGAEVTTDDLHQMVISGRRNLLKHFFDKERIDVETKNASGLTLLGYAASLGCLTMVNFLLSNGANVNSTDESEKSILYHVLNRAPKEYFMTWAKDYENTIKILLNRNIKVDDQSLEFAKTQRDYLYQLILQHQRNKIAENPFILLPPAKQDNKKNNHTDEKTSGIAFASRFEKV